MFERDGWRCVMAGQGWGSCYGGLTFHHLLKASQGGEYTEDNGVTLCVFHNDKVEDDPKAAAELGLVIRRQR